MWNFEARIGVPNKNGHLSNHLTSTERIRGSKPTEEFHSFGIAKVIWVTNQAGHSVQRIGRWRPQGKTKLWSGTRSHPNCYNTLSIVGWQLRWAYTFSICDSSKAESFCGKSNNNDKSRAMPKSSVASGDEISIPKSLRYDDKRQNTLRVLACHHPMDQPLITAVVTNDPNQNIFSLFLFPLPWDQMPLCGLAASSLSLADHVTGTIMG